MFLIETFYEFPMRYDITLHSRQYVITIQTNTTKKLFLSKLHSNSLNDYKTLLFPGDKSVLFLEYDLKISRWSNVNNIVWMR